MHGTYQTVSDLWSSQLPLCTVHTRQNLTIDPALYRYAQYIPDSTWPLNQPVTFMHGTYQTLPDLWSSPLPLCTLHTRQYLTPDPVPYCYARYIPDSTWPVIQPFTVMHGTYQTVPDLWSSPLPLCTVQTRQYLTSDPARYRCARYKTDSTWPLIQPVTVIHGTYETVPDLWSSPLPLCRYIPDSTLTLIQPLTVMPAFNCDCLQKAVGPSYQQFKATVDSWCLLWWNRDLGQNQIII